MTKQLLQKANLRLFIIPPQRQVSQENSAGVQARYRDLIFEIQKFRGAVYLQDQAIPSNAVDTLGRHHSHLDFDSYHIVLATSADKICGVLRLSMHEVMVPFSATRIFDVIGRMPDCQIHCTAVEQFLEKVKCEQGILGEVGGWAVNLDLRSPIAGIALPIACWAQCRELGNVFILSTATVRHSSARILEKLGGFNLQWNGAELPAFFDSYHQCQLKVLAFDIRGNPEYGTMIEDIRSEIFRRNGESNIATNRDMPELKA